MLFKPEENCNGAWLNRPVQKEFLYIKGYIDVVELIYKEWDKSKNDQLIYPLIFTSRHAVELLIKQLLNVKHISFGRDHRLLVLWEKYVPLSIETSDLSSLTSLIEELSSIDPTSTAFRYATNNQGIQSCSLDSLDVKNYFKEIRGLINCLEGLHILEEQELAK